MDEDTPVAPGPTAKGAVAPMLTTPGHLDLYVLILGVVLGIVLGPFVLGAIKPATYQRLFMGQQATVVDSPELLAKLEQLKSTGVSDVAVQELMAESLQMETMKGQGLHQQWLQGLAGALILAILVLMVLETLPDPAGPGAAALRARLTLVRYGLAAIWIALVLAQPALLRGVSLLFVGLLVVVGLGAALVPLRPARS